MALVACHKGASLESLTHRSIWLSPAPASLPHSPSLAPIAVLALFTDVEDGGVGRWSHRAAKSTEFHVFHVVWLPTSFPTSKSASAPRARVLRALPLPGSEGGGRRGRSSGLSRSPAISPRRARARPQTSSQVTIVVGSFSGAKVGSARLNARQSDFFLAGEGGSPFCALGPHI